MKEDQELIGLLNKAIELEYGALFLMPQHIARLEDPELADGLRKACADELGHAEATARLILALGGLPTGDFKMLQPMQTPREMLRAHIAGEKQAIRLYGQALAKARQPAHQEVLRRLLADEERHQVVFNHLLEGVEKAG